MLEPRYLGCYEGFARPGAPTERRQLCHWSGDFDGFGFAVGTMNSELLHQFVEGRPADAELGGGGSDFAAVFAQGLLNQIAFDGLPNIFERWSAGNGGNIGEFEVLGSQTF